MTSQVLRALTQGAYDLQKVRISVGNRICQAHYQASGVSPGESPEEVMADEDKKILQKIRMDYARLTDGLVRLPRRAGFEPTPYIGSYAILMMVRAYEETLKAEETAMKAVAEEVVQEPIWDAFLAGVKGCGPTMAAVMLSRLDITKAKRISQFWAFAGFDVAADGRGRSRRKEHLVAREYTSVGGEMSTRQSITFDPWLKTKLYVLATCFLKSGGSYKDVYDGYKARLKAMPPPSAQIATETRPVVSTVNWAEASDGHRHNAAMRYMLKMFLADLWLTWRKVEGLPVTDPYAVGKLGMHPHHKAA